ncbi:MAG: hypothetical protein RLZZ618_3058 [Pseudomonadota bacterium]|jgi:hypothetical protein
MLTAANISFHRPSRASLLGWLAAAAIAALLWHGPVAQWTNYHQFADGRHWHGVLNAANVLSNLPFLVIGLGGVWALLKHGSSPRQPALKAWLAFAVAVALTAFGSTAYHWEPDNTALVFDRLPIAWACATLLCAFLAERVDPRWGCAGSLTVALAVATLSVVWWWWGEQSGTGDLRAYLAVQFLPILLIPAGLLLRLRRPGQPSTAAWAWWAALALYTVAKVTETADLALYEQLGIVSGHTLKHLLAAAAAACLLTAAVRTVRSAVRTGVRAAE